VAFGALVLVHEGVLLIEVPWAAVLVAGAILAREPSLTGPAGPPVRRRLATALAVVVGPAVAAAAAVALWGRPDRAQVAGLRADAAPLHLHGHTVTSYLGDSLSANVHLVAELSTSAKVLTPLVGVILVAVQALWICRWVGGPFWRPLLGPGNRLVGAGLLAVVALAAIALFATGFDWLRWVADCGGAWLVVQGFWTLLAPDRVPADRPTARPSAGMSSWVAVAAVYLAALAPLDALVVMGNLGHYLLPG
jgi:hypothetical protein